MNMRVDYFLSQPSVLVYVSIHELRGLPFAPQLNARQMLAPRSPGPQAAGVGRESRRRTAHHASQ